MADQGLKQAFQAAAGGKAKGGKAKLAAMLKISKQATTRWKRCPPTRVLAVEKATGVRREVLRPDIYGPLYDNARPPKKKNGASRKR